MPNFWESNPGPRFHGHLKLGEAQQAGYDVHATFPRDGALPHISVYEASSTGGKVERNLYLRVSNGSAGLSGGDRTTLLNWSGVAADVADRFLRAVYDKHLQLNPRMSTATPQNAPTLNASDFPALGARSAPPLMTGRPVATTPQQIDPVQLQLNQLSETMRSVVMGSGAFD